MILTKDQTQVLTRINTKLAQGDIRDIAKSTGYTRVYVSRVLSINWDAYNTDIVKAAVDIIATRDQYTKNLLIKLLSN